WTRRARSLLSVGGFPATTPGSPPFLAVADRLPATPQTPDPGGKCSLASSSSSTRRAVLTLVADFTSAERSVRTSISSSTGCTQAGTSFPPPPRPPLLPGFAGSSRRPSQTEQTRQTPTGRRCSAWQRVGISGSEGVFSG